MFLHPVFNYTAIGGFFAVLLVALALVLVLVVLITTSGIADINFSGFQICLFVRRCV